MNTFGNKGLQRLKARTKGPAKENRGIGSTDTMTKNAKNTGKFLAQEGVGQALKKFAGNVASKAFGVAGMLLSSQKAYAGGKSKMDYAMDRILKENPGTKIIRSVEDLNTDQ